MSLASANLAGMTKPPQILLSIDGRVLAAARALAAIGVRDLAAAAGTTSRIISSLEARDVIHVAAERRHGCTSMELWARIVAALALYGVAIVEETTFQGAGARYTRPRSER